MSNDRADNTVDDAKGKAVTPRTDAEEYSAIANTNSAMLANDKQYVVLAEFARQLERELAASMADKRDAERLDWLDRMNAALNNRYGTNYGWRLILSPNVVRLMRDGRASVSGYLSDIDLHDSEGGARKAQSCRAAIDAAMSAEK